MSTTPTGWQTPKTDWNSNTPITSTDLNRMEGNIAAIETGERTIDQSQTPSGLVGTLRQILDWFAYLFKSIKGTTNYYDAPPTTLAAAKTHIDAAAPHTGHETPSGAQAKVDAHASQAAPHSGHVNKAGDTMTGDLILNGAQSKIRRPAGWATWARGFVFEKEDATTDAGVMALGSTGSAVDHISIGFGATPWVGNPGLKVTPTGAFINGNTVWHAGNDGAGSGLDADTVDGYQTTSAGGTEANRLAVTDANGRVGAALAADNSDTVDSKHASAFSLTAKGSYAGNDADDREIVVGFRPKLVLLSSNHGATGFTFAGGIDGDSAGRVGTCYNSGNKFDWIAGKLDRSEAPEVSANGFYVSHDAADDSLNAVGRIYTWIALG